MIGPLVHSGKCFYVGLHRGPAIAKRTCMWSVGTDRRIWSPYWLASSICAVGSVVGVLSWWGYPSPCDPAFPVRGWSWCRMRMATFIGFLCNVEQAPRLSTEHQFKGGVHSGGLEEFLRCQGVHKRSQSFFIYYLFSCVRLRRSTCPFVWGGTQMLSCVLTVATGRVQQVFWNTKPAKKQRSQCEMFLEVPF